MRQIYEAILDTLPGDGLIEDMQHSQWWTLACTTAGYGLAMTTQGSTRPVLRYENMIGKHVRAIADAVKSWNFMEASSAMAAVNSLFNTREHLIEFNSYEPYENYCTEDLDLHGMTVGVVGHLSIPSHIVNQAKQVYILERQPKNGDYPDTACEYLLPQCNIVLITGSALINKSLPRLLELSQEAYTILTGPTVPMCPALLECGIDRLAGLVISDTDGIKEQVAVNRGGSPYALGSTFLLKRNMVHDYASKDFNQI